MRTVVSILSAITLSLLCISAPARAQADEWEEAPQFEAEVNGKPDIGVRAFQPSGSKPWLLLVRDKGRSALFLDLSAKKVTVVAAADVSASGDYTVSTKGMPAGKSAGSYTVKSGASSFTFEGKKYAVRMRETLVGEVGLGVLLAHSPIYAALRDAYTPRKAAVEALSRHTKPVDFVVMLATWCPTCKRVVPRFLKVMQDAKNPRFTMRFVGIAMGGSEPRAELEKYGHDYPAIIVYQDGKEKGRIVGEPVSTMEQSILNLVKK
ncbi:MAG: thioredoxin family protein [Ignavibacteriae bacterium]|nr:thioredoxin family protein [Ignavibacteriota bacterium]